MKAHAEIGFWILLMVTTAPSAVFADTQTATAGLSGSSAPWMLLLVVALVRAVLCFFEGTPFLSDDDWNENPERSSS